MNALLSREFSKLEDSRIALINRLQNIPQSKLEMQPFPGQWSVAQVFYHLNRAESFSVIYVSKKRLDINNLKRTGVKEYLKVFLLKALFISPFRFKAPVILGDVPDKVDYRSIVAEWDETRHKLKELLDSLPDEILYKNVFKQPAIGRINIFQMIDFMQAHFNRHQQQVERIVIKKPS